MRARTHAHACMHQQLLLLGKTALKQFALNKTGGIGVILNAIEHHMGDIAFVETAVIFFSNTTQLTGEECR